MKILLLSSNLIKSSAEVSISEHAAAFFLFGSSSFAFVLLVSALEKCSNR